MNGPEEIIDGSPDAAYLIGRIAPFKLTAGTGDPTDADTGEPDTDVGDADDAEAGRGVPLTEVDDSGAGADEDSGLEDTPQQRGLMIPASMGLRCQIPDDLESFTVTASWGVYESVPAPEGDESRSSAGTSGPRSRSPSGSRWPTSASPRRRRSRSRTRSCCASTGTTSPSATAA